MEILNKEIGRELKVSELRQGTVVCLWKSPYPVMVTVWVVAVKEQLVHFLAGDIHLELIAERTGPDLESITDDTGRAMKIFEYLGKYDALPG